MIVTPGIIEGGKKQNEINFELGKMCAKSDYVVIVGNTNKKSLEQGLIKKNFNQNNIKYASSLEESKHFFSLLTKSDTILFLNDLPDDYN